jgi:hypothetical protein
VQLAASDRSVEETVVGPAAILLLVAVLMGSVNPSSTGSGDQKSPAKTEPAKSLKINLDTSVEVKLPEVRDLSAVGFHTSDGKEGWVLRLPGNRPIATPAYADGLLFVGGGYGSHEFYAFKAKTGEIAWKINTSDDGPTAAVVEGGYVAFNTPLDEHPTTGVVPLRIFSRARQHEWSS